MKSMQVYQSTHRIILGILASKSSVAPPLFFLHNDVQTKSCYNALVSVSFLVIFICVYHFLRSFWCNAEVVSLIEGVIRNPYLPLFSIVLG